MAGGAFTNGCWWGQAGKKPVGCPCGQCTSCHKCWVLLCLTIGAGRAPSSDLTHAVLSCCTCTWRRVLYCCLPGTPHETPWLWVELALTLTHCPAACCAARSVLSHEGGCFGLAFDRLGGKLASCGVDKTVKLWDPATGAVTATLHVGGFSHPCFLPCCCLPAMLLPACHATACLPCCCLPTCIHACMPACCLLICMHFCSGACLPASPGLVAPLVRRIMAAAATPGRAQ